MNRDGKAMETSISADVDITRFVLDKDRLKTAFELTSRSQHLVGNEDEVKAYVQVNGIAGDVTVILGDMFSTRLFSSERWCFIMSNPPVTFPLHSPMQYEKSACALSNLALG